MAVQPGAQFEQLPMFMSANEILSSHKLVDQVFRPSVSNNEVLSEKLKDAKNPLTPTRGYWLNPGESLYDSISSSGIKRPINLAKFDDGTRMMMDGHHRLAVQHDLNPDAPVIPVEHGTGNERN
jgi:hypothetical protein